MTQDLAHIWEDVRAALRRAVPAATYDIWLDGLEPEGLDGRVLTASAPAELRGWIVDRFGRVLDEAAAAALGEGGRLQVTSRVERLPRSVGAPATAAERARAAGRGTPAPAPAPPDAREEDDPDAHGAPAELNPKLTFGQFVIGDGNHLAHASALSVAELPGQAYNPLFIYGPPGVGKTHLLHSIGNYVLASGTGMTVRYTTAERFTNEFITSLRRGSIDRLRGRYRAADVLLIDDVQFLEAKAKTEEEFFHTFNALYDAGSQLVLTSDRLPADLEALEDRLRERFESGLVTDIKAPDVATRMAVLRKRVDHDGVQVGDPEVLRVIADRIPTNIRALEGALIRVVAFASLTGRPLTPDVAEEVLAGLYPRAGAAPGAGRAAAPATARVTLGGIVDAVCEAFGVTREDLLSSSRAARLAWPRQLAMHLAREHTDESLPAIGRHFGGRGHTTVMYALKRTSERLAHDAEARDTAQALSRALHAGSVPRRPPGSDRRP
jgi:chromosomal replication initiator protein